MTFEIDPKTLMTPESRWLQRIDARLEHLIALQTAQTVLITNMAQAMGWISQEQADSAFEVLRKGEESMSDIVND